MKYVRQFAMILAVSFTGELLRALPLPVPASIYGLCLMLFLLMTGAVKIDQIEETADFMVEIMPMLFIPAAAGLLVSWQELKGIFFPVIIITSCSTLLVMVLSGRVTQWVLRRGKREDEK